jgi:hypothetical protein
MAEQAKAGRRLGLSGRQANTTRCACRPNEVLGLGLISLRLLAFLAGD